MSSKASSNITRLFNIFNDWFIASQYRIVDFFRDRIGEISFGCFIAWASEDYTALEYWRNLFKQALLAEIFIVDPNLILSFSFDQIYYDWRIKEFWEQSNFLRKLLEEHKKMVNENVYHQDINTYLQAIASTPPFNHIIGIIQSIINRPILFGEAWANSIWDIIVAHNFDILQISQNILDKFNKHVNEQKAFRLPRNLVTLICPWIIFIIPQILASIRLCWAYHQVTPKKDKIGIEKNIYKNLLAELYFDNKYIDSVIPLSDGSIIFQIPKKEYEKYNPKEILINVMGLKLKYPPPYPEFPALYLSAYPLGLIIRCVEDRYCKRVIETDSRSNYVCTYLFDNRGEGTFRSWKVVVLDSDPNWELEVYIGRLYADENDYWYYGNRLLYHYWGFHSETWEHAFTVTIDKSTLEYIAHWIIKPMPQ
jgi:hypothetical protein